MSTQTTSTNQPGPVAPEECKPGGDWSIRIRKAIDPNRGWTLTVVAFAVIALLPLANGDLIPVMTEGVLLLMMCYGWNLVGGYLGELSFGHMIFWGIGGYGAVYAVNSGGPFVLWLVALVVAAGLAGVLMALIVKLSGQAGSLIVSIFTLVLSELVLLYVSNSERFGGVEGVVANTLPILEPYLLYFVLVMMAAIAALSNVLVGNSRLGRNLLAIRDDRVAAQVAGVNVEWHRYFVYFASAAIFALGGAYQSWYSGYALPEVSLAMGMLILVTLAIFIGGQGTTLGPLLGWVIIYGLEAVAQSASTSPDVSLYAQLIEFGVALLILRIVLPKLGGVALAVAMTRGLRRIRRSDAATAQAREVAVPDGSVDIVQSRSASNGESGSTGVEIVDVHKSFGAVKVLSGVSFSVRPGEVVGIVGPNGAGKSTLCNLISGIESVNAGSITVNGDDITFVPARRRSAIGIGRAFQAPRLFSSLSLAQNVSMGESQLTEPAAAKLLTSVGIPGGLERRGDDSQFLARRLTEVTKATLQGRQVLLLDEPLAGLTSDEHALVLGMARQAANAGASVLIVEHLIPILAPAVDRLVVLAGGVVIADGPPTTVLHDEAVVDAYLGTPHREEK